MTSPTMDFDPPAESCPLCAGVIFAWGTKERGGRVYQYDRCRSCGFVFVNPRPSVEALSRHYNRGNDAAVACGESVGGGEREIAKCLEIPLLSPLPDPGAWPRRAMKSLLHVRAGPGRFLDVGAGEGGFTIAATLAGLQATALELDPDDADHLRSLRAIEVIQDSFERLDREAGSFEYVLMSHVLEHAHDAAGWVRKASELLSPGGVLAVMLPNFNRVFRKLGGIRDPYFFPPEHLNHFSAGSLRRLCRLHGMETVHVHTEGRLPSNLITRRIRIPAPLDRIVKGGTFIASAAIGAAARATGTGANLVLFARKSEAH